MVIWVTGLSGAGKSTLATLIYDSVRTEKPTVLLDGDELREIFGVTGMKHDRASRLGLAMQYAKLSKMLSSQGMVVIIATISMFKEVHDWNRSNMGDYFEVYLKVDFDELRRRDPKEIYKKFDSGELKNVAGLDFLVDEPNEPDLLIENKKDTNLSQYVYKISAKILGAKK